jgi:hypothetical protein
MTLAKQPSIIQPLYPQTVIVTLTMAKAKIVKVSEFTSYHCYILVSISFDVMAICVSQHWCPVFHLINYILFLIIVNFLFTKRMGLDDTLAISIVFTTTKEMYPDFKKTFFWSSENQKNQEKLSKK